MDVILFGIVMDVKPLQFLKADSLMDVTPLPMFNDVKPLHPLNVLSFNNQLLMRKTVEK